MCRRKISYKKLSANFKNAPIFNKIVADLGSASVVNFTAETFAEVSIAA